MEINMQNRFNFLNDLNLTEDVKGRVSLLLQQTVDGSDVVYKTPLGENNDPESLLAEWDTVFTAHLSEVNGVLETMEQGQRSKFGPRSIQMPWDERKPLVDAYFEGVPYRNYEDLNVTLDSIYNASSLPSNWKGRLRPLSKENAMKYLKNNTNAGLPYYVRKGRVKEIVLDNFDGLLERQDPCVMFTRTQEQRKTRAVWGFPIADTLNEMQYYRPLLEIQREQFWRAALQGPIMVDLTVTNIINEALKNNESLVSIDFSSYDATLQTQIQEVSFKYIKDLFQSNYHDDIDYIAYRFNSIGLVTPEGIMLGPHGVPSGSTFTNEVDSIAQFILASNSGLVDQGQFQIQGDDGAYRTHKPYELMEYFTDFGLKVNEEKSDVSSEYLIYLQNLYHKDYRQDNGTIGGIYPTYRALNRLVYQERFDDFSKYEIEGKDFYAIRTLTILENCRNHPLFKEFVKFIHAKDKYGLKPSQHGIDKYVQMQIDKTGAEGIIQHQYGDQIRGIRQFESYKVVSEL